MVDRDTAPLCHSLAGTSARSRRLMIAGAIVLGMIPNVLAPAASARTRGGSAARTHGGSAARTHGGCAHANAPIGAASRPELQRTVVCLINQQRSEHRLPRLHMSRRLNRSAQGWTNTMVSHGDFGHGADFAARISAVGFDWSSVGENIATGYRTPAAVVRAWMASTGHCQNILSPSFLDVGTGVIGHSIPGVSSGTGTWTQDFALPMGRPAPSSNQAAANGCPYR